MNVKCKLTTLDTLQSETVEALLDSGCTGSCIDSQFVKDKRYETRKIPRPIPVYNADGTLNKNGAINEFVILLMEIDGHVEKIHLAVTNLDRLERIEVDLFERCPEECRPRIQISDPEEDPEIFFEELGEDERMIQVNLHNFEDATIDDQYYHIRAQGTMAQKLAEAAGKDRKEGGFEKIVPEHLHQYKDIARSIHWQEESKKN
ncbi:hypothetical protein SERLA73DRAFT_80566 [Serpula lacrymans var. lacrymans S7.3]|uniref:Uncharacterized protein n=1 Tax=Serpula lacrymans var. lacrymans (strain S7.3) TaxID=936435 RepID=F8QJX8_SERL3|nr:hypothetical protein SERLA73DRAFT_80566 [Serpula lacrymans var. lacrymans S7.3]